MKSGMNSIHAMRSRQPGFTFVEFLIALAVLSIILLIASPGITALLQSHYVKNTSGDLYISLDLAKSVALKRRITVRMCPSSDGFSCRKDGDWNKGWVIFSDDNSNGTPEQMEILETFGPPNQNIRVQASGAVAKDISFTFAGLSPQNDSDKGKFQICPAASDFGSKTVEIDEEGWLMVAKNHGSCSRG